ncbi:MAG: MASE3 domain-containing protein, partial [Desulfobacterales bacterium]
MKLTSETNEQATKIPTSLVWSVIVICIIPTILNLFGLDFGSYSEPFPWHKATELAAHVRLDFTFASLSGAFTHTLLEWSAFCAAIFTVLLAFLHYRIKRDVTTLVIGIALVCAGTMDAFHTLAANRLIHAVADNRNLVPFTWAICRLFNALIMIVGVGILLVRTSKKRKGNFSFVFTISLIFGFVAYATIHICATNSNLPQTMFPNSVIIRPYDVAPLVLFLFAGVYVFSR